MKAHTFSGYFLRSLIVICGFVALIGVLGYFVYSHKAPLFIKKNRYETVKASGKDVFSWLMEGAGIYLFNSYKSTWQKGIEPTRAHKKEQKKILHYKLQIEHIIDTDPRIQTNHQRPTLYLHGWGDTKNSAKLLKAFCDVLPGDIVTFQFRDHGVLVPKICYSNLGQMPDVLSTIYTLKWMKDTLNISAVDLFGYSRGGATLLNTLAVLHDASSKYDADLERIGVTAAERKKLLALIQSGCHVLNCPLTNMNVSISQFMKNDHPFWVNAFQAFTRYKKNGLQGLDSAQLLNGLKLNMLIHFQHKDTIVSNKNEAELYLRLFKHNPHTTFIVLGNNGGHLHSHDALSNTIHTFKKRFGSSYDPEYAAQYEARETQLPLANRLLCPGPKIEETINDYYAQCQVEDLKKMPPSLKRIQRRKALRKKA